MFYKSWVKEKSFARVEKCQESRNLARFNGIYHHIELKTSKQLNLCKRTISQTKKPTDKQTNRNKANMKNRQTDKQTKKTKKHRQTIMIKKRTDGQTAKRQEDRQTKRQLNRRTNDEQTGRQKDK